MQDSTQRIHCRSFHRLNFEEVMFHEQNAADQRRGQIGFPLLSMTPKAILIDTGKTGGIRVQVQQLMSHETFPSPRLQLHYLKAYIMKSF